MKTVSYTEKKCPTCGLGFLPVDWLEWRKRGYCRKECAQVIIKTDNGTYVISSYGVWLPGSFDSRETANYAFQFQDSTLSRLQAEANKRAGGSGGVITMEDLKQAWSKRG